MLVVWAVAAPVAAPGEQWGGCLRHYLGEEASRHELAEGPADAAADAEQQRSSAASRLHGRCRAALGALPVQLLLPAPIAASCSARRSSSTQPSTAAAAVVGRRAARTPSAKTADVEERRAA